MSEGDKKFWRKSREMGLKGIDGNDVSKKEREEIGGVDSFRLNGAARKSRFMNGFRCEMASRGLDTFPICRNCNGNDSINGMLFSCRFATIIHARKLCKSRERNNITRIQKRLWKILLIFFRDYFVLERTQQMVWHILQKKVQYTLCCTGNERKTITNLLASVGKIIQVAALDTNGWMRLVKRTANRLGEQRKEIQLLR